MKCHVDLFLLSLMMCLLYSAQFVQIRDTAIGLHDLNDYHTLSSCFIGWEDPTAPSWGGAFGGGLYCVPPGVYHGRLHQPSVYLWGADDYHQLHQNRGHSGRAHLHQGRSMELLPQVGLTLDQNIIWLYFASNYNNTKDFLGINFWS